MALYIGNTKVKLRYIPTVPYTITGVLNIVDGIASGFTDKTDYFILSTFSPNSNKWKFTTKVRFNSLDVNMSLIDRNSSTRNFQISMRTNGKWKVNISNNGSSKANEVDGTHTLSTNTWYYLTFEYTGTQYILKYSTDATTWTTDITISNSNPVYSGATQCMGHTWYDNGGEKWDGEIDMNYTHLLVEGQYTDTFKLHCLEGI